MKAVGDVAMEAEPQVLNSFLCKVTFIYLFTLIFKYFFEIVWTQAAGEGDAGDKQPEGESMEAEES